jgi:hypothetical protein
MSEAELKDILLVEYILKKHVLTSIMSNNTVYCGKLWPVYNFIYTHFKSCTVVTFCYWKLIEHGTSDDETKIMNISYCAKFKHLTSFIPLQMPVCCSQLTC